MPWGGPRPGSGRKPKSLTELAITGDQGHRGRILRLQGQVPEVLPAQAFAAPDYLTIEERAVWDQMSPHAFTRRTLTPATCYAFVMLCRNIVLERSFGQVEGRNIGSADHRGVIKIIDAALLCFDLRPMGKALYDDSALFTPETGTDGQAAPKNKLAKFIR